MIRSDLSFMNSVCPRLKEFYLRIFCSGLLKKDLKQVTLLVCLESWTAMEELNAVNTARITSSEFWRANAHLAKYSQILKFVKVSFLIKS